MMDYCIRMATGNDQAALLVLMQEHATFEGHPLKISQHHRRLNNLESLPITLFVVCSNEKLVGYISMIKQFSSWEMDYYLYLDCLYLSEEARGLGIGSKLMEKLKVYAVKSGLNRIEWQTPIDNFNAIEFYHKLGAVKKSKQRFFWHL